jgi:hypothetical protein
MSLEDHVLYGHTLVDILIDLINCSISLIINFFVFDVVIFPLNVLESDDFDGLVNRQHFQDVKAFFADDWKLQHSLLYGDCFSEIFSTIFVESS